MNQEKIGNFIQQCRKKKNLTQLELAEKLGVTNRSISKWETGKCLPDYSILPDLCNELDITINELLSGKKLDKEEYQKSLEDNFVKTIDYNNKQRNKRIKKWAIILVIMIVLYFIYKAFIVYFYFKPWEEDYKQSIEYISLNKNAKANKIFDEINIYVPNEFKLITDKAKSILVNDSCDLYAKNFVSDNDVDAELLICINENKSIYNLENYGIRNKMFPYLNVYNLYEKYNMNDILDLVKYNEEHQEDKYNIFTDSDKVKMRYIASVFTDLGMSGSGQYYFFNNDIKGYLHQTKNAQKIYQDAFVIGRKSGLYYNDNLYDIMFINRNEQYFNHENALEIISSIYS